MILETERLILRPIQIEDAADMFEYAQRSVVSKYVAWDAHQSLEETTSVIQNVFLPRVSLDGWFPNYAVCVKSTQKMIGTCSTVSAVNRFGNVEIGYALNDAYWNQGYATEATKALIDHLFSQGVRRIAIRHHVDNIGSKRVIEKCGFVFEGVLRQLVKLEDAYSDIATYSLLREEYK